MRVRLRDVAERAGVSNATVSLVLNGKDGSIGAATRERVTVAAEELGYRPNALARSLRGRTTQTIGFISDAVVTTPHAGAMIQGVQDIANDAGFVLLLGNTSDHPDVERRTVEALLDRQIDAAIYATMFHRIVDPPASLAAVPTVLLDARPAEEDSVSWVVPDEAGGARAAVEHLIAAGHRRIGFINESDRPVAAAERESAYRSVLRENGLDSGPDFEAEVNDGDPVDPLSAFLGRSERPTALFCFNDRIAAGAYIAARRLGLRIPEDLSIVGFDNQILVAEAIDPGLTTVQLPHEEMGRWAMEQALRLLDEETGPRSTRMPCPLVERGSVAPPSQR